MGDVCLITGCAGGLGRAFAHALLRCGASGIGVLDIAGHEEFAKELQKEYGTHRAFAHHCNVTNAASVSTAYKAVRDHFGRLDIVINNAGIALPLFEDVDRHIAVNLSGVVYGTQEAIRIMNADDRQKNKKEGVIIQIASIAGLVPVEFSPVYAATKAGVVNFTRSLRWLKEAYNIRVNCICPNFADTNMVRERPEMEAIVSMQPGGLLQPSQVAEAVLKIVNDENGMTGQAIVVTASKGIRIQDFGKADSPAIPGEILREMAKL